MTRLDKVQAELPKLGLDAVILYSPHNRRYITGFASSAGFVLVTQNEAFFVTDSRYIEAARANIRGMTVGQSSADMGEREWLERIIEDCCISTLGFEEGYLTYKIYQRLEDDTSVQLLPADALMKKLRAAKDENELAAMKRAQAIAETALDEVLGIISPGMTERQIAAELTYRMLLNGGEGNSFEPIVVAGKRSSMPHGTPGDNVIENGDFITMDFGCIKDGYCSDMTRTVALGSVSDEMRQVYDVVLKAQLAGIAAARPGAYGREIDAAARRVIAKAGYGEYFGHGFGHSLGLEVHESPSASPLERGKMPEGAVISAEPGIYLPNRFGVRIEDVLYLTGDGCENITKAPKELIIL